MKKVMLAILSVVFVSQYAFAETARFQLMDKNSDKKVDSKEFYEANSNLSENAFHAIDKDNNKFITPEEWDAFVLDHSRPEGMTMGGATSNSPAGSSSIDLNALPVLPGSHQKASEPSKSASPETPFVTTIDNHNTPTKNPAER